MGRRRWRYQWTRIPNGSTAPEKGVALALDDKDLFVSGKEEKEESKPEEEKLEEEKHPPVGLFQLFRYTSCCDRVIIVFATLVAMVSGASMPAIMVLFGGVVDKLVMFDKAIKNGTANETMLEEFIETTGTLNMYISVCGVAFFCCNYIYVTFFSLTAANQALRIRCRFMQAMLKQDMAWYDTHKTGDFAARITGDLTRIQEGMNEKVGICLSFLSATILCVCCGIYYGWKLALVILCVTPVLTVAMAIMSKIQASVTNEEMEAYGAAGAVAEEVFSSIRTVVAFAGQKKEIERYERCLVPASKKGIKRGLMTAIGGALTWLCIFAGYALAFWYGVKLILEGIGQEDPEYTGGKLIIVFFNVMSASMFIGQTAPYFEAFALARGAAAKIYSIIDRVPEIDGSSEIGLKPKSLDGHIRLKDVHFNYPSRPTVPILQGLNLEAVPGETIALVGSSGCGKSTVIQLLLRFYDTLQGSVELDGVDVRALNIGWLRDQIGLVGQEPVLFSTSIEENIKMGRRDATHEEVVKAAETANALQFIEALPKKWETEVGQRGTQLSGGQKQRIAIARALVKNPRILLLDEATSALDTESEAIVQAALDQARLGRTTIVVAHRLSTIRTADKIVALEGGVVKETGTHEELMEAKGLYYQLVVAQTKDEDDNDDDKDEGAELPAFERQFSALSSISDEQPKFGLDRQLSTMSNGKGAIEEEEDEEVDKIGLTSRLLKICAPEWPYALVGGIAALGMGLHFPAYGILFGAILGVLSQDKDVIQEENTFYCLLFVGLAITSFICGFCQTFLFSIAGEKLTFRLRKMVFANIITQDISFFDDSKNAVGALCSRLNSDASSVQGATGSRIAMALQALSTFIVAIFIALYYNWKVGLVCLVFVPLVLVGALLEAKVVSGHMRSEKKGMEKAAKIATEAIDSIRTVVSLHQEQTFYNQYYNALLEPHK